MAATTSCQLGQQGAGNGVTCALNAYGTKVHGQHIEGGFGAALNGGGDQRGKAVYALALHGLDQHGTGGAARKRFDQRSGQGVDKAGVHAHGVYDPANA